MENIPTTSGANTHTADQQAVSASRVHYQSSAFSLPPPALPLPTSIIPLLSKADAFMNGVARASANPTTAQELSTPSLNRYVPAHSSSSSSMKPPLDYSTSSQSVTCSLSSLGSEKSFHDAKALMKKADLKLVDACRRNDSDLALQARRLFAQAKKKILLKEPLDDTARKQALLCMFLSQRCVDINDLLKHGIPVSDHTEICYNAIEQFLESPISKIPKTKYYYRFFVKKSVVINKINNLISSIIQNLDISSAIDYIKFSGDLFYRKKSKHGDMVFYYCQQQYAYLMLTLGAQTGNLAYFETAKSQLYKVSYQIRDVDYDMALRLLHEAHRADVAAKIIAKGYQLSDIHAFLTSTLTPRPIGAILTAFNRVYMNGRAPIPDTIRPELLVASHDDDDLFSLDKGFALPPPLAAADREALFNLSLSFRPTAERSSAASVSSAIAKAIPSSAAAAPEVPRLAGILPRKPNKADGEQPKINAEEFKGLLVRRPLTRNKATSPKVTIQEGPGLPK